MSGICFCNKYLIGIPNRYLISIPNKYLISLQQVFDKSNLFRAVQQGARLASLKSHVDDLYK